LIVNLEQFNSIRTKLKNDSLKLVFTNGCFDILHKGHVYYLNETKKLGDFLIVGLNSDSSVKIIKGKNRPINNENDRAYILDNLKPVDAVIIFNEETPINLISMIKPDYLVKGGDWKVENIVGSDLVRNYGGKVISIKYMENYSTTALLEEIKSK
jgi:rfaE bifunctional protein nucleotidyltransferase chain/domain